MPDINHPVRHALAALGVGHDPAVRSLYYRWAGLMADIRWERPSTWGHDANKLRTDLLRHFNDDRVEMRRQMEILRGHVFAAIDHAKVEGAKKRAEQVAERDKFLSLQQVINETPAWKPDCEQAMGHDYSSHRYQK